MDILLKEINEETPKWGENILAKTNKGIWEIGYWSEYREKFVSDNGGFYDFDNITYFVSIDDIEEFIIKTRI